MRLSFLFLLLCLSVLVWAQSDNPGPIIYVTGTDVGCSSTEDCDFATGCTSYTFKVTVTQTYDLGAWTECTGSNCWHCAACVKIYDAMPPAPLIAQCNTMQQCANFNCSQHCTANLSSGRLYRMDVCLISCHSPNCLACGEEQAGCTAHGCISNSQPCP